MNKSEFVATIADRAGITKIAAANMLDVFIDTVTDTLKKGEDILLPGFLSFSVTDRAARVGRNPQSGAAIQIKASRVVKLKVGKTLKEAVQ